MSTEPRISGFNEKEYFYELYDKSPEFDNCEKSVIKPVSDIRIDTSEGNPIKLIIKNKELIVLFSKNNTDIIDLNKIYIEVKSR